MTSVSRVVRWIVNIMWKKDPGRGITYAVYDIRTSTELCSWLWLIFWKWVEYIVELLRMCPISFNWCQWHNSKDKRLSYFHTVEQVYQLKLHWPYFQTEPQPNNLVSYLYVTIQQFQRLWVNAALIPIFQSRVKLNQRLLLISPDQRTIRQNWPRFILQKPVYPTLTPILNVAFLIYKIYRRLKTKNSEKSPCKKSPSRSNWFTLNLIQLDVIPWKLNNSYITQAQNKRLGKFYSQFLALPLKFSRFVKFL